MAKSNEPEAPTVSAVDPRDALRSALDSQAVTLSNRLRQLYLTRKQIDREIEATEAAARIVDDGIAAASDSLAKSRETALMEDSNATQQ